MAYVNSQAIRMFNEWKLRSHDSSYLIFQVTPEGINFVRSGSMTPDGTEMDESSWTTFVGQLPEKDACWVAARFVFHNTEGDKRTKTTLIRWIPSQADRKDKMQYAMLSTTIGRAFEGLQCSVQGNQADDLSYGAVLERALRFAKN